MKRGVIVFILICWIQIVSAQPPGNFLRTIGGSGDDVAYSCKPTLESGYIVAGSTSSFGDNTDFYLIKVDSMGNDRWQKHFGGSGNEVAKSVIQLADSGFILAGYTSSFGAGGYDVWVIRTDKNGFKIWDKTYGGADWDFAQDLVQGNDGFIYLTGYTESFGSGKKDGFVYKIDLTGVLQKTAYYGGGENDELNSILKLNDGNLGLIGTTESFGDLNGDIYFLKINNLLDTLYTKRIGGLLKDVGNDLTQNNLNDEIYLCGAKSYSGYSKTRSYMYRMTSGGQFKSDSNYYRNSIDESFISVCTSYKTYAGFPLTAFSRTTYFPINKHQTETFVTMPAGNSYSINASGGPEDEFVYSIEATKDGGFVYVGSTTGFGAQGRDIYMVKQDSTIINYESIVGIEQLQKSVQELQYLTIEGNKVMLTQEQAGNMRSIQIFDMTGNLVSEITNVEDLDTIDLNGTEDLLLFLRIVYTDGRILNRKILRAR